MDRANDPAAIKPDWSGASEMDEMMPANNPISNDRFSYELNVPFCPCRLFLEGESGQRRPVLPGTAISKHSMAPSNPQYSLDGDISGTSSRPEV
jgi:hypothetical protein